MTAADTPAAYARAGLALIPIPRGRKGPQEAGWQHEDRAIRDEARAAALVGCNIGLAHRWCGTCAVDVDDFAKADAWLAARGINLQALLLADGAVQIRSGRANRAKLIYRLPPGVDWLPTQSLTGEGLELRCASRDGRSTVQDVLPPSIHPETGKPYEWVGDWRRLPTLPDELLRLWRSLIEPVETSRGSAPAPVQAVPEGGRNSYLTSLAGTMRRRGMEQVAIDAALLAENAARCQPPLPETEVRAIAASVSRYAPAQAQRASAEPPRAGRDLGPLVWLGDVEPVLHQDFVVDGLLGAGTLAVIFGDSNSGKTFFTLDLALHVAAGQPWRGHQVRRGLVVYVAAEGGHGIRNRLAAYKHHADWTKGAPLAVLPQAVDLLGPQADAGRLVGLIQAATGEAGEAAALVVLDTLARVMPGGNENASEDMSALVANCDTLRAETGATVLLIHHVGKDATKGARGHSSLRAAADTEILVEGLHGTRTATVTKQRDLPCGQRFGFDLVPVDLGTHPETGNAVTACLVATTEAPGFARKGPSGKQQAAVLRLVEAEAKAGRGVLTTSEVTRLARDRLGIAKSSATSAVLGLTKAGFLVPAVGGLVLADGGLA